MATLPIKIYTLGQLTMTQGENQVVDFISLKTQLLYLYLAFNRGEHSRESLANLFWENPNQELMMNNLSKALNNLKQLFPETLVISRRMVGILDDVSLWIDAKHFEGELKRLIKQFKLQKRLSHLSSLHLVDTLALYRGDFLKHIYVSDNSEFESWRISHQTHFQQEAIQGLQWLIEYYLACGMYENGIAYANHLLKLDALNETAYELLMKLLIGTGKRTEALKQYRTLTVTLQRELQAQPSLSIQELATAIQKSTYTVQPPDRPPYHLPAYDINFVARPTDVLKIKALLDTPAHRLITLLGLGGAGKTSLALQIGHEILWDYPDGVFFISLVGIATPEQLLIQLSRELELVFTENSDLLSQICGAIRQKQLLLILDNFEHLTDAVPLVNQILEQTQQLKIIVTSRERLRIPFEQIVQVSGLDMDSPSAGAVQLFLQAAQKVSPGFPATKNMDKVLRLCQILSGLPLAIILAAQWVHLLSMNEIIKQVEADLNLLGTDLIRGGARHSSIKATLEYSWQLLTNAEQDALMRLAIIPDSFTTETALEISQANLQTLLLLQEKSLLSCSADKRCEIHMLVRQFAQQHAEKLSIAEATRDQFVAYYTRFAATANQKIMTVEIKHWFGLIETEMLNLEAALNAATAHQQHEAQMQIALILAKTYRYWGYYQNAFDKLAEVIQTLPAYQTPLYGDILENMGHISWIIGETEQSKHYVLAALALRRQIGDLGKIAASLIALGRIYWGHADYPNLKMVLEEALEIGYKLQDTNMISTSLSNLGIAHAETGELENARHYFMQSLTYARASDSTKNLVLTLLNIGSVYGDMGDYAQAIPYAQEALDHASQNSHAEGVTRGHILIAGLYAEKKDYLDAQPHLDAGIKLATAQNDFYNLSAAHYFQGQIYCDAGYQDRAVNAFHTSFELAYKIQNFRQLCRTLEEMSALAYHYHTWEYAVRFLAAAHEIRQQKRIVASPHIKCKLENLHKLFTENIPNPDLVQWWEQGQALDTTSLLAHVHTWISQIPHPHMKNLP